MTIFQRSRHRLRRISITASCAILAAYVVPTLSTSLTDTRLAIATQRLAQTGGTGVGGYAKSQLGRPDQPTPLCADRSGPAGYPSSVRQQTAQRWHVDLPLCSQEIA